MVASKQEIISVFQQSGRRLEGLIAGKCEEDLKKVVYQDWSAKQLICHLASTSGSAAFFIMMAQSGQGVGAGFDVDRWNAEQVAARQDRPMEEILAEFRAGHESSIRAVESAPDDLMVKQVPDFSGGMMALADLIKGAATDHETEHLNGLERGLRA